MTVVNILLLSLCSTQAWLILIDIIIGKIQMSLYELYVKTPDGRVKLFNNFENKSIAEHWRDVISLYDPNREVWLEEVEQKESLSATKK
jgi:hypothetical protein